VIVVQSVAIFNDFTNPLYYLPGKQNVTVQLTLYNFQSQFSTSYNLLFTNILLITIPPLIVFLFFNRQIVAGMTAGAVKGNAPRRAPDEARRLDEANVLADHAHSQRSGGRRQARPAARRPAPCAEPYSTVPMDQKAVSPDESSTPSLSVIRKPCPAASMAKLSTLSRT